MRSQLCSECRRGTGSRCGDSSAGSLSLVFQRGFRDLQGVPQPLRTVDVESIYKWEQRLKQYEEQSGDVVSFTIKMAVLTRHLVGT